MAGPRMNAAAVSNNVAPVSIAASYEYCTSVAREQARNFYYSFLVLPAEKRRAFCAVYAFMRHSDDISDDDANAKSSRQGMLTAWRERLEQALQGQYGSSSLLPAFHDTLRKFSIPADYFFELLRGAEMDLDGHEYKTFSDLYRYCYRVAGVVGLTCIRIFGFPSSEDARACQLAESCGVAFQLTNILRDLREDAECGRVYLPAEDLARFGVSPADFLSKNPGGHVKKLIEFEVARAWEYYRAALPLLAIISRDSQPSLWAMIALYSGILKRIEASPLGVFRRRAELSDMEKFNIVARGLWMRFAPGAAVPAPF
jgi:phytoene synthase